MDKSKHTVTIPLEDYEKLVMNGNSKKMQYLSNHIEMLRKELGILIDMDINNPPSRLIHNSSFGDNGNPIMAIRFYYNKQ